MQFRSFIIIGLLLSTTAWGIDRRPAVEDFVGIEVDHPEATPEPANSLVDLGKDIQTIQAEAYTVAKKPNFASASESSPWGVVNTMAVILIIALPLFSWLFVMNRLRKRAGVESASNVEVLERYRREREQGRKKEDFERKAS